MTVRVVPKARKNEIVEILNDGTVKVRLVAAPQDEIKLNQALLEFLSVVLQVPVDRLELIAGLNGPDKLVSVLDLDTHTVQERILSKIS